MFSLCFILNLSAQTFTIGVGLPFYDESSNIEEFKGVSLLLNMRPESSNTYSNGMITFSGIERDGENALWLDINYELGANIVNTKNIEIGVGGYTGIQTLGSDFDGVDIGFSGQVNIPLINYLTFWIKLNKSIIYLDRLEPQDNFNLKLIPSRTLFNIGLGYRII